MKCNNCGAPLNGRECSYCGQKYTRAEIRLALKKKAAENKNQKYTRLKTVKEKREYIEENKPQGQVKTGKVKRKPVNEKQNQQFIKLRKVREEYLNEEQTQQNLEKKTKIVRASIIVACIVALAALINYNLPDIPIKWGGTEYTMGTTVENDYVEITLNDYHIEKDEDTTTLVVDFEIKNKGEEDFKPGSDIYYFLDDTRGRDYPMYREYLDSEIETMDKYLPRFIHEGEQKAGEMVFELDKDVKGDLILTFIGNEYRLGEYFTIKYRLPSEEVHEKIEAGQVIEDYYTVGTKVVNDEVEILVNEFYIEKRKNDLYIYIYFELKYLGTSYISPQYGINYDIDDKDGLDYPEMVIYSTQDLYPLNEGEKGTYRTGFELNHDIANDLYLCFSKRYDSYEDKWEIYYKLPKKEIIEKIEALDE